MATVSLHNVKKVYPYTTVMERRRERNARGEAPGRANLQITEEGVVAVQAFNIDIADQEFIVLVGPSGRTGSCTSTASS